CDQRSRDGSGRPDDARRGDRARVRVAGGRWGRACHSNDLGWPADSRRRHTRLRGDPVVGWAWPAGRPYFGRGAKLDAACSRTPRRFVPIRLRARRPELVSNRPLRRRLHPHPRAAVRSRGMETVLQDVRVSLRALRRSPGFALTAIATLALGIGATTAIFTTLSAVLLK